jgi:hypothetical protein
MSSNFTTLLGLALLAAPLATGCASRAAPFNQMDQAQISAMRLTQPPPPPPPVAAAPGAFPGIPGLPIPPEMQAAGQQILQGAAQALPGLIPPGLIPGQPAAPQPQQPQLPQWNGLSVVASVPVMNEDMKNDILDLFGDEDSFQAGSNNCGTAPGLGFSMVRPNQPNVDLLVSFTCSKAMGVGFQWPHKADMLKGESHQKLSQIYQALFGMAVPPGS